MTKISYEKGTAPYKPMYLANRYYNWTERTGWLRGDGLTWVTAIPAEIIAVVVSLCYWLILGRRTKK